MFKADVLPIQGAGGGCAGTGVLPPGPVGVLLRAVGSQWGGQLMWGSAGQQGGFSRRRGKYGKQGRVSAILKGTLHPPLSAVIDLLVSVFSVPGDCL